MKRLLLILTIASVALCQTVHAQYYSVNYDTRTVAAMVAAFGTEAVAEGYYREQVDDILKHYTAAEVATAGIFAAKFLEHKALSDLGIWNSRTENYYYRRIYRMVAEKIMPKIWVVAKQMLHSPQTAIYWGSYLMKVCDDTKSLCMQFESVVTNSLSTDTLHPGTTTGTTHNTGNHGARLTGSRYPFRTKKHPESHENKEKQIISIAFISPFN